MTRYKIPRRIVIVTAVFAVGLPAVNGWAQTTEDASSTAPTEPYLSAPSEEAPEIDADAARRALNAARQERRVFREVRRLAAPTRISSATQDAPQGMAQFRNAKEKAVKEVAQETTVSSPATDAPSQLAMQAVPQEKPAPAADLANIEFSFGPNPGHAQDSPSGDHPASKARFSAVREGEVTVETRLEGRDAKGLPVAISAAWNAADPATVDVSPAEGSTVKITVRGTGQSNLTVAGPGFTKDLWISATAQEGKAIQVEITQ